MHLSSVEIADQEVPASCHRPGLFDNISILQLHQYHQHLLQPGAGHDLLPRVLHVQGSHAYIQKPVSRGHLALTMICFIGVMLIVQPSFLFGRMN